MVTYIILANIKSHVVSLHCNFINRVIEYKFLIIYYLWIHFLVSLPDIYIHAELRIILTVWALFNNTLVLKVKQWSIKSWIWIQLHKSFSTTISMVKPFSLQFQMKKYCAVWLLFMIMYPFIECTEEVVDTRAEKLSKKNNLQYYCTTWKIVSSHFWMKYLLTLFLYHISFDVPNCEIS